jgi:hypothetical protein
LAYAREGTITEEYLLDCAAAYDKEQKSSENPKGTLRHGVDGDNGTSFTVVDYQAADFLGAVSDMALSITYQVRDAAGNVTTKLVMVHLVDTAAEECENGTVRFISAAYADTLPEQSIWRTGAYASLLSEALENSKTGEEYTAPTMLQQALGAQPVKKPGSGTWNHVQQIWKFTHEEVKNAKEYIESNGIYKSRNGFLSSFGHCRIE